MLCVIVHIHLHGFKVLHDYFSLGWTNGTATKAGLYDQQQRQLAVRFYSRCCCVSSGVIVSARRMGLAMNRFYTKQTKIFGPNFHIWIFLKVLKKLFVAQKINLEDTLIFFPWLVKQIWNWNTKNKNLWLIYTFKCHLFMF